MGQELRAIRKKKSGLIGITLAGLKVLLETSEPDALVLNSRAGICSRLHKLELEEQKQAMLNTTPNNLYFHFGKMQYYQGELADYYYSFAVLPFTRFQGR